MNSGIEYEIREELARLYDAYVMDDSMEIEFHPQLARYSSYSEYIVGTRNVVNTEFKKVFNEQLEWLRSVLPENVRPIIGEKIV